MVQGLHGVRVLDRFRMSGSGLRAQGSCLRGLTAEDS